MRKIRVEIDSLGQVEVPVDALYGANTWRGVQNLTFSQRQIREEPDFLRAFAQCKLAAALANRDQGAIEQKVAEGITQACQELIDGRHTAHLVIDLMEGSGGTSTNMNFNEVIANRAQQLLGGALGRYDLVHPNDHVNRSQSTNDVYPSAMKIATHSRLKVVAEEIDALAAGLRAKSEEFRDVLHLGRTCLQDAQPMYLGQTFGGYAALATRLAKALRHIRSELLALPLGGTAIGTGFGSRPGYKTAVFAHLGRITGEPFAPAEDPFDAMQNLDVFSRVSAELRTCAVSLAKIASDFIVLGSGPAGGIGELVVPAVQAGSSIMPGKVNPVIAMGVVQVGFAVVGNDNCVAQSVQAGQLEINHFEPVVLSRVTDSMRLLERAIVLFRERCVAGIQVHQETSARLVFNSSAIATAFIPRIGYDAVSSIVKDSHTSKCSFIAQLAKSGLVNQAESRELVLESARLVPASE